jgi:small-conductance mechanosensitive channel
MNQLEKILESDLSLAVHISFIVLLTVISDRALNFSINRLIHKRSSNEDFDKTNLKFIQRGMSLIIYLVGFAFVIYLIPSFQHVAKTLLAGAGVIVAVIGFASQQVLSNLISGIMIVLTKPYRIGHRVKVRDTEGVVEDITLRHTIIKNYENRRIVIPNSIMNSEVILNSNLSEDICCEWVEMGISYTSDIDKAKAVMKEVVIAHPLFIDHREPLGKNGDSDIAPIRVMEVGDFSITLRASTWAKDPSDAFVMGCDLRQAIKERFDKEGIEIPYPYRNVIQFKGDQSGA